MSEELSEYYRLATESELQMAEAYLTQKRKAAAQEALLEARFWFMKCRGEDLQPLQNRITNLEKTLY